MRSASTDRSLAAGEAHRISDSDDPGLDHVSVDAEWQRLAGLDSASVVPEDLERGGVDLARLGVAAGDQASSDVPGRPHARLAGSDLPADPGVLRVRVDAVDLDQHPEAPGVDVAQRALIGEPAKRCL